MTLTLLEDDIRKVLRRSEDSPHIDRRVRLYIKPIFSMEQFARQHEAPSTRLQAPST